MGIDHLPVRRRRRPVLLGRLRRVLDVAPGCVAAVALALLLRLRCRIRQVRGVHLSLHDGGAGRRRGREHILRARGQLQLSAWRDDNEGLQEGTRE